MRTSLALLVVTLIAPGLGCDGSRGAGPARPSRPAASQPEADDAGASAGADQDARGDDVTPITTVEQAIERIASYEGRAEDFQLPIAESLLDPAGMNMALIGDRLLARSFLPDGFEQRDGYRIYRYKSAK